MDENGASTDSSRRYVPPSGYDYLATRRQNGYHDNHSDPDPRDRSGVMTEYPGDRPFIRDDYRRDPNKPVNAFPENNRKALMSALGSLSGKIRSLELERLEAESNLKKLTRDTTRFQNLALRRDPNLSENDDTTGPNYSQADTTDGNGTDVHSKLDSAEQRCKLLEKQLDHMRHLVQRAEHERTEATARSTRLDERRAIIDKDSLQLKLDRISDLEREQMKLTATQALSDNKIRELQEKLEEEKHYSKMMESRAAELKNTIETRKNVETRPKSKKTKKKKKSSTNTKATSNGASRPTSAKLRKSNTGTGVKKLGQEPPGHYKLNLAQLPFISGQSTTPSHSLPANFQEVLSIMKTHNTKLCTSPRNHLRTPGVAYFRDTDLTRSSSGTANQETQELTDLLLQLQDEYGLMSFEHQELCQQICASSDPRLKEDLERELDSLVGRMEAKGQQISRLRRHQDTLMSKSSHKSRMTSVEIPVRDTDNDDGHVEVTTTIRTKNRTARTSSAPPGGKPAMKLTAAGPQASLNVYKNLKKMQSKLRKDDLSWD